MRNVPVGLHFDREGLIPTIVQDARDGRVLMAAFMSAESLEKTIETGEVHFWSRSRKELWRKGATSGNVMRVVELVADCDGDCLLARVEPAGPACHTGKPTCFFTPLSTTPGAARSIAEVLTELAVVIRERARLKPEGSYTASLLEEGVDRIARKLGEEATEVVIAAKNADPAELVRESADLLFHLLVLWESAGLSASDVAGELERRRR